MKCDGLPCHICARCSSGVIVGDPGAPPERSFFFALRRTGPRNTADDDEAIRSRTIFSSSSLEEDRLAVIAFTARFLNLSVKLPAARAWKKPSSAHFHLRPRLFNERVFLGFFVPSPYQRKRVVRHYYSWTMRAK